MATTTYSQKEVFSIIINVLNFVVVDLRTIAYRVGLKQDLVLNEALLHETPDPKILAGLDDPLSLMLKTFANDVLELYHALAVGQQIDLTELAEDEPLADVASVVYWSYAAAPFFYHDDLKASMLNYIRFLPSLIAGLEKLIVEEQFDDDQELVTLYLDKAYFENLQAVALPAVKLMAELGCLIYDYQTNITQYVDEES